MIAGGPRPRICEIGMAGFNACKSAVYQAWRRFDQGSRPYDADRDVVMAEKAGNCSAEEYENTAKARGAKRNLCRGSWSTVWSAELP